MKLYFSNTYIFILFHLYHLDPVGERNSAIRTIFFWVVSVAQLVEVTDSAVLGGVVEVVRSNPALVNPHYKSVSVSDPM